MAQFLDDGPPASGAVESLVDIQTVIEALQKPPANATEKARQAWELLSEAFSSPEVLIASFGRVKDASCPMCHVQQHEDSAQHSAADREKLSSRQVWSKGDLSVSYTHIQQQLHRACLLSYSTTAVRLQPHEQPNAPLATHLWALLLAGGPGT